MSTNREWPLVDIHAHVLPDVDDGPGDVVGTRSLLDTAYAVGIDTIVATPHLKQDLEASYQARVDRGIALAQPEATAADVELLAGFEVLIQPSLIQRVDAGDQLTINGSRYMLVELPFNQWPLYSESVLFELQTRGIVPILAHPERYLEAIADPAKVLELADRGVAFQVTYASVTGTLGKGPRELSQLLIERNMVDLMATDAHSDGRRLQSVPDALNTLVDWVGAERAYQVAVANPKAVVTNRAFEPAKDPVPGESTADSRRKWKFW